MKNLMFWIKSYILYAQIPPNDFARIRHAVAMNNHRAIKVLSLIGATIFAIISTCALTLNAPFLNEKVLGYLIGFGFSLLVFVLNEIPIFRYPHFQWIPMLLMELGLLGFGMFISLVAAPLQMTISFIVMLVLVPLLFTQRPIQVWLLYAIIDSFFIICAAQFKPSDFFIGELINTLCFSFIGILIGSFFNRTKIERFLFEDKVNQMDDKEMLNKNLKVITDIYTSIHQIDLATGYFFGLRSNEAIDRALKSNHEDANAQLRSVLEKVVVPDQKERILDFANLRTLPEKLKGKRSLSCEFQSINKNWYRCRFIVQGKVTKESIPTAVILTVRDITDEVNVEDKL